MHDSDAGGAEHLLGSAAIVRTPARPPCGVVGPRDLLHSALLYRSIDELAEASGAFLEAGIDVGDGVVLAAATDLVSSIRAALPADKQTSVVPVDLTDATTPARALRLVIQTMCEQSEGGRPVRLVCQHDLRGLPAEQFAELCRADAAFNAVCPVPSARVLCCFDARELTSEAIDVIGQSHPMLVEHGTSTPSSRYRSPHDVLAAALQEPLPPPAEPVAELSAPSGVGEARKFVASTVAASGLTGQCLADFVSAANEVVTNAFRHAEMESIRVWCAHGRVVCEVRDRGAGFVDPLAGYRIPVIGQESGWGVWLARQLVDVVEVRSCASGSVVRLHASVP